MISMSEPQSTEGRVSRRQVLGGTATTLAALAGCTQNETALTVSKTDGMEGSYLVESVFFYPPESNYDSPNELYFEFKDIKKGQKWPDMCSVGFESWDMPNTPFKSGGAIKMSEGTHDCDFTAGDGTVLDQFSITVEKRGGAP